MLTRGQKRLVGVDVGSSSVKVVELSESGSLLELARMGLASIGDHDASQESAVKALRSVLEVEQVASRRVATSVSGPSVAVRNFHFPKLSPEEIEGAVWYEGGQVIAFDIKGAYVDYSLLGGTGRGDGTTNVLFAAAKNEEVDARTDLMEACGLEPRIVGVDALVLLEALLAEDDLPTTVAVLNVGARFSNLGVTRKDEIPFIRDIEIGGDAYTQVIAEAMEIPLAKADEIKISGEGLDDRARDAIIPVTHRLATEVARSLVYYHTRDEGSKVDKIYISGGGSLLAGLAQTIAAATEVGIEPWSPLDRIEINSSRFDPALVEELAPFVSLAVALAMKEDPH